MTLGQGRLLHCFGEEVFIDRLTLTGGTVTANTVTGLSGLTANKYDDQDVLVLSGTLAGRRLRCVTNTTTVLTFQQDVATLGLANTDKLAFGARGKRPTVYTIFYALKDELMLATPKHTFGRPQWSGFGLRPAETHVLKTDFESKIPFLLADGRLLFTIFGDEYVTGTDVTGGGGSTLNGAIKEGETVFDVAAATNYTVGDYIQVDTTTNSEIRKITAIATNTITVDYPLRKNHATAVACNEVTKPFTHTLQYKDKGIYWTHQGVYDESPTPIVYENHGCFSKALEVKVNSGEYVLCNLDYQGMCDSVDGTKQAPSTTLSIPYTYDKTLSGISIDGITYAQVRSMTVRTTRKAESLRYSSSTHGVKPAGSSTSGIEMSADIVMDIQNNNILTLLRAGTEFTTILDMVRTASSDEARITLSACTMDEAPHPLTPDGATIKVTVKLGAENLVPRFIDSIPYYPMGIAI